MSQGRKAFFGYAGLLLLLMTAAAALVIHLYPNDWRPAEARIVSTKIVSFRSGGPNIIQDTIIRDAYISRRPIAVRSVRITPDSDRTASTR